ncbi:MAG: hypothetical protein COA57_15515 [Flavobacteriales bacterium]|nr:MAG: hypothetical protein COA57_15515 [Flavobacteriales bacterium]
MFAFKKIRRGFIDSGKLKKYLAYAAGEIILVTIGILLAVQINNWNEGRKERKIEFQILNEVVVNMKASLQHFHNHRNRNGQIARSFATITDDLKQGRPANDSTFFHLGKVLTYPRVSLDITGYDLLKNKGIHIVSNPELRRELTIHYEKHVKTYGIGAQDVQRDYNLYMLDFIRSDFEEYIWRQEAIPYNYELLRINRTFIGSMQAYYGTYIFFIRDTDRMIERTEFLIKKLDAHLLTP